jgi:plastocyanin
MRATFKKHFLAATVIIALASPFASHGATANVTVNNSPTGFVPATTNINAGDTVLWTWPSGSNFHNVTSTSTPQAWTASSTLNGPATFSLVFNNRGTFPYECSVHLFTGKIVVVTNLTPPNVSITNPLSGAVLAAPASVTARAMASDTNSGGSVTNVEFRSDNNIFAEVKTAPFTATTNGLGAGTHSLAAVASNNGGLKATNTISISVVTPVPLVLGQAVRLSASSFQLSYAANSGLTYFVQRSTNLAGNWTSIATNTAASGTVIFTDTNAIATPAFYRVVRQANP